MIDSEDDNMKTLKIKWQRLIFDEQTCPRCGSTEQEVEKAVSLLKESLRPLGIRVALEKRELTEAEFKKDPLQSNKIWIKGRPLEDWIGGKTGRSQCCDVCGTAECRTIGVGDEVYEAIPADLIIRAGLIAAAELLGPKMTKGKITKEPSSSCCSKLYSIK